MGLRHARFESAFVSREAGDRLQVLPEAGSKTGEKRRSESGGFRVRGTDDGYAKDIRLKLHEGIVGGGPAVDAQFEERSGGVGLNRVH